MLDRGELEGRFDALFNSIKHNKFTSVFPSKPLYQICKSLSGGTPNKSVQSYWSNGTIPWVSPKDFKTLYMYGEEDFITEKALQDSSTKLVPENTILIVFRSGVLQHTFPVAIATREMAINQDLKALIFNEEVLPYYALYYFNTFGNSLLPLITKHSTTVQSINTEQFSRLAFPIPPKDIQQTIISIMDAAYETKKTKEAEAKKLLDSIDIFLLDTLGIILPPEPKNTLDERTFEVDFTEIFAGRLDVVYHKPYYEKIEEALEKGKFTLNSLGSIIDHISYGASVANNYTSDISKGIPLLRIKDLSRNEINLDDVVYLDESLKKDIGNCYINEGEFLISRSGSIGIVAMATKQVDGFAFGSFMIKFRINETIELDKRYLSYFLNSKIAIALIEREKIGAIQGNITIPTIKSIKIPLPPFETQNCLAEEITKRRNEAKKLQIEAKDILDQAKKEVEKIILGENK